MTLAIDLYCGLGGWAEGLLAEGYDVVGFDIERHEYGAHRYPAQLVLQDVRTLHGAQFRNAALIVASPPCQAYSYRAMPWSRAKALPPPDNELFDTCFRIQREACEAAGRHIPLIVENVRGAQKWVGRARWNYGSYYLWGDVPALMPISGASKLPGSGSNAPGIGWTGFKSSGLNWSNRQQIGQDFTRIAGQQAGVKQHGSGDAWWDKALDERRKEATAIKNGNDWFGSGADCSLQRRHGSKSTGRKAASAMIAKIPLPLARHIAAVYRPRNRRIATQEDRTMSDSDPAWLLGLAKLRASQIVRLVQLYQDGEIGRDGMLEAVRHEAEAILAPPQENTEQ